MNVLVTGAAGYIGGRMMEALCLQAWVEKVVGTDIREPEKAIDGCKFYRRDIREDMTDIFEAEGIDTVVHTAYVLPPIHDKGLMENINKGGTVSDRIVWRRLPARNVRRWPFRVRLPRRCST